jgi:hypothetical protein
MRRQVAKVRQWTFALSHLRPCGVCNLISKGPLCKRVSHVWYHFFSSLNALRLTSVYLVPMFELTQVIILHKYLARWKKVSILIHIRPRRLAETTTLRCS